MGLPPPQERLLLTLLTPSSTGFHGAIARHDEGGASPPQMARAHSRGCTVEKSGNVTNFFVGSSEGGGEKKCRFFKSREASCFLVGWILRDTSWYFSWGVV